MWPSTTKKHKWLSTSIVKVMEDRINGWWIRKRVARGQRHFGLSNWDVWPRSTWALIVSCSTHHWNLTLTFCSLQLYSMTHGQTGLQTFLRITNSLLWSGRLGQLVLLGKITICVVCFFFLPSVCGPANHFFSGGSKRYRSPQEFYPHMHWLLNNTRGECICKHCDHTRSQKEIDKIFHLPPHKESPKGPIGPKKHKRTKKPKAPRGVTSQREMVINRNSITTGTVSTLQHDRQEQRIIGFRRSHPFKL